MKRRDLIVATTLMLTFSIPTYAMNDAGTKEEVIVTNEPYVCETEEDNTRIIYLAENEGFFVTIETEEYQKQKENEQIEIDKWNQKENEYPYAAYIWKTLTGEYGYSEPVAAGIIGNAMTEVGGWVGNAATMNLNVTASGKTYYGTWQWKKKSYKDVVGAGIEGQVKFLMDTIEKEYNDFGKKGGYSYQEFLGITDPATAALSFAKTYERCGSSSYGRRQRCAQIAYDYFTK